MENHDNMENRRIDSWIWEQHDTLLLVNTKNQNWLWRVSTLKIYEPNINPIIQDIYIWRKLLRLKRRSEDAYKDPNTSTNFRRELYPKTIKCTKLKMQQPIQNARITNFKIFKYEVKVWNLLHGRRTRKWLNHFPLSCVTRKTTQNT